MTYDDAVKYLLRDDRSVEAECGRAVEAEVSRLREALSNLRASAEQYLERNPVGFGVIRFRAVIEASKT